MNKQVLNKKFGVAMVTATTVNKGEVVVSIVMPKGVNLKDWNSCVDEIKEIWK